MSFGFSIGDITFKLYTNVSSGRKGASRDLKELEDVLFSLKCSLDHLGEVAQDVLSCADNRQAGTGFKENLDHMISACASTLQDLNLITKEYREFGIDPEIKPEHQNAIAKKRTFNDVKQSFKVNWKKVRWDQEKQSLQQYREKLGSHTDAINLILTSSIWANTIHAETSSKSSHNKTHQLLEEVLKNPQTDLPLRNMITEIHTVLMAPNLPAAKLALSPRNKHGAFSSIQTSSTTAKQHARPDAFINSFEDVSPEAIDTDFGPTSLANPAYLSSSKNSRNTNALQPQDTMMYAYFASALPQVSDSIGQRELPSEIVKLNNERRAFGAKEFEAFKKRHHAAPKSRKPAFLTPPTPNLQQLRSGIPYIFQPVSNGRLEVGERATEIEKWTRLFAALVANQQTNGSQEFVELLVSLNQAVEQSDRKTRHLFYQTSDSAGFISALDQLQSVSKSVRVMKEVEEFQDAREEWEEGV